MGGAYIVHSALALTANTSELHVNIRGMSIILISPHENRHYPHSLSAVIKGILPAEVTGVEQHEMRFDKKKKKRFLCQYQNLRNTQMSGTLQHKLL